MQPTIYAPGSWSTDAVADWMLNVSHLRLVTSAPYLRELFSPGFLDQLSAPSYTQPRAVAAPLRVRHGGGDYFIPGTARDLLEHTSCAVACIPAVLRVVADAGDLSPPSHSELVACRSGSPNAMRRAWSTLHKRVRRELLDRGSTIVVADIRNFGPSIDMPRLLEGLLRAKADQHAIGHLRQMHEAWDCYGCPGLPLTGAVPLLSKFWLSAVDERLRRAGIRFVRIQDDFRLFAVGSAEAQGALAVLVGAVEDLGMHLNCAKTRIVPPGAVGYRSLRRNDSSRFLREGILRPLLGESLRWKLLRTPAIHLLGILNRRTNR
jgi:hypothetical protein